MKKVTTLLFSLYSVFIFTQVIKVNPYLQDASPNSIFILWETDFGEESIVEWGESEVLGNITLGSFEISVGTSRIHTVKLDGLTRFTKYYYRVKTGLVISEIYSFKTPPFASDNESFRIIAMSDMQQDSNHPNKFKEIVEDGIIEYLNNEIGGDIIDNVALVIIPGDLVDDGIIYSEWEETFFTPSEKLFSKVPVYPVIGNHEENSIYYYKYFKLPNNGTSGFEEHWWYKDYGNVRIIGIDSNPPYDIQVQLDWLDNVLEETCSNTDIDFVFTQLHHPFKSELWTPGESNFTGEVITRMEQFSTNCNKPSIHFFGHTHGYSRGQSRDHKHLWINVATAGGAIDNWGEFLNFDYDEFSVSQDEYGFVVVEITKNANPKIEIKRISRGDQDIVTENTVTDNLVMRLNPNEVTMPVAISPINNEEVIPECVFLKASEFNSPNINASHGQSHWQISESETDFSVLVEESWKNFENWYFEVDTQAIDDLTDEKMVNLNPFSTYWWRVRYRDKEFNWSNWSTPKSFNTVASNDSPNLLINSDAENNIENWVVEEGIFEALSDLECNGVYAHSGEKYFSVGGLCEHSEVGRCTQDIDVSIYAAEIDIGNFMVKYGGYLSNYSGVDLPEMRLLFLDQFNNEIGVSNTISTRSSSWLLLNERELIPALTRVIKVELKGTKFGGGEDNDSYFDDLFLKVGIDISDCEQTVSFENQNLDSIINFKVNPNPFKTTAFIEVPNAYITKIRLTMVNSLGAKVSCPIIYKPNGIVIEKGNLTNGTYFFLVRNRDNGKLIGRGKFIVI